MIAPAAATFAGARCHIPAELMMGRAWQNCWLRVALDLLQPAPRCLKRTHHPKRRLALAFLLHLSWCRGCCHGGLVLVVNRIGATRAACEAFHFLYNPFLRRSRVAWCCWANLLAPKIPSGSLAVDRPIGLSLVQCRSRAGAPAHPETPRSPWGGDHPPKEVTDQVAPAGCNTL